MVDSIAVINPATEELIQKLPVDEGAAVAQKVERARAAQPDWAAQPLSHRIGALKKFRDLLIEAVDSLAATMTAETGKPISQSKNEILATPERIDFFIESVARVLVPQQVYQEPQQALPGIGSLAEVISYDPLGVIANISAWNYPYFVGTNVFAPALLTGNAVVYKPSEVATMTGLAIAALLHEAGIPKDVFVPVIGAGATGAALLEQPIDGIFFTGSYETGQKIAIAAAPKLIKIQLELGSKDPAYVCPDVDIAVAAASLADGAFYNNGQSCCAVERIYVHQDVYEPFIEKFLQTVQDFKMGAPTEPQTYLGPLSRQPQLTVLEHQVKDALAKGAQLLCGGHLRDGSGWYFEPTVLANVMHDMQVMQAETFGPVIGIQQVTEDEQAIALMQDTKYGLTASVYSASRDRAIRILSRVNSGSAYWNCCDRVSPRLPWTGRGHSGIGTTLSVAGIYAFLQPRAWHLKR
jgi:acyl-CoA reductase-like NAD-dependent aldehyde dehydrogenase